ncbi:copper oxidase [Streptomyces albus subsp. albus]|nr:copper oxidase [Streptomyces albus subsp. albus]
MPTPSRRAVLGAGIAVSGGGLLSACSSRPGSTMDHADRRPRPAAGPARYVEPDGPEVIAAERRRGRGAVREVRLTAGTTRLDLGGLTVDSWTYGQRLPGQEVRVTAGDTLALTLENQLPQPTTLHGHGVALRNDMDGAPGLTQEPVAVGGSFNYRFTVPNPGTYWLHPHSGVQLDRGLYTPLVVEDPREPLMYDHEWVVVLDDWLDGVDGSTPDAVMEELNRGMPHMGRAMDHGVPGAAATAGAAAMTAGPAASATPTSARPSASTSTAPSGSASPSAPASPTTAPAATATTPGATTTPGEGGERGAGPSRMLRDSYSRLLRGESGNVAYPYYLINGRTAKDPQTFRAKPGDRIRIRFINAGADTPFRVALGGHSMTITHTDGYPVEQTATDALLLGMGERYDVLVTAKSGAFPLTAVAEGKEGAAMAVLRTGAGAAPGPSARPTELGGRLVTADRLLAAEPARLPPGTPDRTIRMVLTGTMARWDWKINHEPYDPGRRLPVRAGERVRLSFVNRSQMWHPMHLHGHTGSLAGFGAVRGGAPAAGTGARKDTVIVLPRGQVDMDFDADNPGLWMLHCHNLYHSESGMMTVLGYQK